MTPFICRLWIYMYLVVFLTACHTQGQQTLINQQNTIRDLMRKYRETRTLVLIYGSQNHSAEEFYRSWADSISAHSEFLDVKIRSDQEAKKDEWKQFPLMLVGSPASNILIKEMLPDLPLHFSGNSFSFAGMNFNNKNQVFSLSVFPNPSSPEMPLSIVTAVDDSSIIRQLQHKSEGRRRFEIPFSQWPWQVQENGNRIAMGAFGDNWEPDPKMSWQFHYSQNADFESPHYRVFIHKSKDFHFDPKMYTDRMEKRIVEIKQFLGKSANIKPIDFHVYESPEYMGLMTGEMKQSFIREKDLSVHTIYHPQYSGNYLETENRLIVRQLMNNPELPILEEGLAAFFADQWQKEGYAFWSAQLFRSGDALNLKTLLDQDKLSYESPIIRTAMAASMINFLIQEWGKDEFLQKYLNWNPQQTELNELEKKWKIYQVGFKEAYRNPDRRINGKPFMKGMTFAHEGYLVYNGYGSGLAQASIQQLRDHHVNSIAIVPYSGMRDPKKPAPFHMEHSARSENDASVVFSHFSAKSLNMYSLLKPQIWVGGHWPGDIEMKSNEEWETFFEHYRRWIRHYALLAEIHQMDMLCIGVEFLKATIQRPEDWRRLIKDMRQIYKGPVTYAANWGEEIEKLSFADELDFIGLNCYYPLSHDENASEQDLKKGFRQTVEKIAKISKHNQKEVIFTEIGFRSIKQPWVQPHERAGEDAWYTEQDQAICYEIVLEEIKRQPWCKGIFWWKWPSYFDYYKAEPLSFTPNGKKAANVLKHFYGKWP